MSLAVVIGLSYLMLVRREFLIRMLCWMVKEVGNLLCQKISRMIMSWNIRRLNNPLEQNEIRLIILKFKLAVMGVLEAKIKERNAKNVWASMSLPY